MAAPMMAICGVIGFNSMWNELPFAMLLMQDQKLRTLMQGLAVMGGEYGLLDPIQAAALLVAAGPPILVYIAFQKHVTLGAFAGAVKG
jgi:ABC-type glycerol-3-phosphate transport system permease component